MSFRGPSAYVNAGASLGSGGNQTMDAQTGTVTGAGMVGDWHPTIIYLVALLAVEWIALVVISKYI